MPISYCIFVARGYPTDAIMSATRAWLEIAFFLRFGEPAHKKKSSSSFV